MLISDGCDNSLLDPVNLEASVKLVVNVVIVIIVLVSVVYVFVMMVNISVIIVFVTSKETANLRFFIVFLESCMDLEEFIFRLI